MDYKLQYQRLLLIIKNSTLAKEITTALEDINKDETLLSQLFCYHQMPKEDIRNEIYSNPNFLKYKKFENEINLLIIKINKIFKELELK